MRALLVTLFAGLSTVIGALFVKKNRNTKAGAFSLAFATGIMLTIALGELFPEGTEQLGTGFSLLWMVIGACLSLFLDIVIPHHHDHEHEHEDELPGHYMEDCECAHESNVPAAMVLALLCHNVLEGLATGVTVISDLRLGINMAIGIAIHNIPIGTTLAVSLISSGRTKADALFKTALVGLSQPFGALIGILILNVVSASVLAACNCIVAGILIFISFDELWPAAKRDGSRNLTIFALLAGICFITLSGLLF